MSSDNARPGFCRTVQILLGASRKRAAGRRSRQHELLHNRSGRTSTDWSSLSFVLAVLFMVGLNIAAAFVVKIGFESGQRAEVQRTGRVVVSHFFLEQVKIASQYSSNAGSADEYLGRYYSSEAERIAERYGGSRPAIEQELRNAVRTGHVENFVSRDAASPGLSSIARSGEIPAMLGSLTLFLWAVMLVTQGEGLELDIQRRRHPMWAWLFSHPVPTGAVFLAEMLSPIAANPIYWGGPGRGNLVFW